MAEARAMLPVAGGVIDLGVAAASSPRVLPSGLLMKTW